MPLSFNLKVNQGIYTRGIKEYARTDARQFMEASWQNLRNARISAGDAPDVAARYASENLIGEQLYLNIFNKPDKELFDADGRLAAGVQILPGYAEDLLKISIGTRRLSATDTVRNISSAAMQPTRRATITSHWATSMKRVTCAIRASIVFQLVCRSMWRQ